MFNCQVFKPVAQRVGWGEGREVGWMIGVKEYLKIYSVRYQSYPNEYRFKSLESLANELTRGLTSVTATSRQPNQNATLQVWLVKKSPVMSHYKFLKSHWWCVKKVFKKVNSDVSIKVCKGITSDVSIKFVKKVTSDVSKKVFKKSLVKGPKKFVLNSPVMCQEKFVRKSTVLCQKVFKKSLRICP